MPVFTFTLIVAGSDLQTDERINALFEAGCDDALAGRSDGIQYLDFDREADSFEQAVLSAVADIETVEGLAVVHLADAGLEPMPIRLEASRESHEGLMRAAINAGLELRHHCSRIPDNTKADLRALVGF